MGKRIKRAASLLAFIVFGAVTILLGEAPDVESQFVQWVVPFFACGIGTLVSLYLFVELI